MIPKMTSKMVESAWANIGFFFYQLDAEVRRLECLHLKILIKKQSTGFNQTCFYIYIYNCHLFALLRVVAYVTFHAEYILESPMVCITKELAIFSIYIAPVHSHMSCQTCCRSTYFLTE